MRPVSALSHPETTVVKRLTPAVVPRISGITGSCRVVVGTVLYMCTSKTIITTTNCGLPLLPPCPKVRLSFPILAAANLAFSFRRAARAKLLLQGDILRRASCCFFLLRLL